jgi:hypothetical protein
MLSTIDKLNTSSLPSIAYMDGRLFSELNESFVDYLQTNKYERQLVKHFKGLTSVSIEVSGKSLSLEGLNGKGDAIVYSGELKSMLKPPSCCLLPW